MGIIMRRPTDARRSLRLLLIGAAFWLALGLGSAPSAGAAAITHDKLIKEYWRQVSVVLAPKVLISDVNRAYGTSTLMVIVPKTGNKTRYLLEAPTGTAAVSLANQMGRDTRIASVEPIKLASMAEASPFDNFIWGIGSGDLKNQYALALLEMSKFESGILKQAHELSKGQGATVAILDTGVDLGHPMLSARWTSSSTHRDYIDGDALPTDSADGLDNDTSGQADEAFGHGTFVAGVVNQVAPDARLMPLRVMDADGVGNEFVVADAIVKAADSGANIVNTSLVINAASATLDYAIDYAISRNVLVIAAAGNLSSTTPNYPAASPCALGVASLGQTLLLSSFSNYGDWVDLTAPGEWVQSAFPRTVVNGATVSYAAWSGTSTAAPFVAGQAALIRGAAPTITHSNISAAIAGTAFNLDQLNSSFAGRTGAGLPRLVTSLQQVKAGQVDPNRSRLLGCSALYGFGGAGSSPGKPGRR